jgi:hypothetical protein
MLIWYFQCITSKYDSPNMGNSKNVATFIVSPLKFSVWINDIKC